MNLFQTAPIVDQLLNYKYQTKLKSQQGDIDTGISEAKNETNVTTTEMSNESQEKRTLQTNLFHFGETLVDKVPNVVGIGIGGYALGKNSKNNNNKGGGNSKGSGGSENDTPKSKYDKASEELDKLIGNTKIDNVVDQLKQIKNIDSTQFFDSTTNSSIVSLIENSKFSVGSILPIVTTGLGAIGLSLSTLMGF